MGYLPDPDLLRGGTLTKGGVERQNPDSPSPLSTPGQAGIETSEPKDSSALGLFEGEWGGLLFKG